MVTVGDWLVRYARFRCSGDVMQATQVVGAQTQAFRTFPQVSEFLPYATRAAHGRNPRRNHHSSQRVVAVLQRG